MKISPVSKVAVCTTVRFAASGWIFCPRFATSQQERRCTRAQRAPEGRGPGWPEFHAPADVAPTTSLVASTNLGQNAGDPWVAPTISIPQTGAISGLGEVARSFGDEANFLFEIVAFLILEIVVDLQPRAVKILCVVLLVILVAGERGKESARQEVVNAKIRFSRGLGASFEANRTRAICKVAPATSVGCCRWRPAAMMIPLQPPGPTSVSARSRLAKRCFASGCARPARTLALRVRLAALARASPDIALVCGFWLRDFAPGSCSRPKA